MGWVGNQRKYSEAEDELSFIKPSEILAQTTVPPSLSSYRRCGAATVVTHEQMFSVEVRAPSIAHADWTEFLPMRDASVGLDAQHVQQRTWEFSTLLMPYPTGYGGGLHNPRLSGRKTSYDRDLADRGSQ